MNIVFIKDFLRIQQRLPWNAVMYSTTFIIRNGHLKICYRGHRKKKWKKKLIAYFSGTWSSEIFWGPWPEDHGPSKFSWDHGPWAMVLQNFPGTMALGPWSFKIFLGPWPLDHGPRKKIEDQTGPGTKDQERTKFSFALSQRKLLLLWYVIVVTCLHGCYLVG